MFPFKRKSAAEKLEKKLHKRGKSRKVSTAIFWTDEKWVKVVLVKGKPKHYQVEMVLGASIDGKSDDEIVQMLANALPDFHLKSIPVFVSHPANLIRSRLLKLPSVDSKELATMVDLQIEKHTPDSKEETLSYFKHVKSDAEGYSQVFLVMTHQDRVSRSVRIAQKVFGDLQGVSSDIDGISQWMNQFQQNDREGTLIIDLDVEYATILVMHDGEVCFHRSIATRRDKVLADITGAEAQQFFSELHRSVMAYDEEAIKGACSKVHLFGDSATLGALVDEIKKEIKLPVTVLPGHNHVQVSSEANQKIAELSNLSFAGCFGLLSPGNAGDLTPASVSMRKLFHRKVHTASVVVGQILFGVFLVFAFLYYGVHKDLEYVAYLKKQNDLIEEPTRNLQVLVEHLNVVQGSLEKRGVLLDAMAAIAAVTSSSIRWTGISYELPSGFIIKGVSRDISHVFEMVGELEKSPYFLEPEARRVTKRKVDGEDITDFEIVLPIAGMNYDEVT